MLYNPRGFVQIFLCKVLLFSAASGRLSPCSADVKEVLIMPLELAYKEEQEARERQQDGAAKELNLQKDEQRQITTHPVSMLIRRFRGWFEPRISTRSCQLCVNWRARSDDSGYCICRATAGISQMGETHAQKCELYTEEPF